MTVDPSDSSYMPSVVVLSAGDSIQTLKEIKTVHISATDSVVTLMEDAHEVRLNKPFFFHNVFPIQTVFAGLFKSTVFTTLIVENCRN